ncbi:uncharacterized protein LOC135367178 [Ornithodoros turicata]|uniref:uncharacterized protein LOC135367178 n=1 Tax=Ornithodoros turicata TaxID=34597 RepID=UPI0031396C47
MNLHDVVYVTNLAGQINNKASVKWSPENKIAVLTDEGIRILNFPCSPSEGGYLLHVEKSYIRNPDAVLDLAGRYNADFLLQNLDPETQHYLMLDHTLCPDTSNATLHKTYRTVEWSPQHLPLRNRCLLATLTFDHRLRLLREGAHGEWETVTELSDIFYGKMKERWKNVEHPSDASRAARAKSEFEQLMQRTFSVAAVEIAWSHLFRPPGKQQFALLIEAMRNGLLVFWKVQPSGVKEELCCEVIKEEQTTLTFVSRLCWQETSPVSGMLVVGSHNGTVVILPVVMEDNTLNVGSATEVWESDQIPVQQIVSQASPSSETFLIFVTKSRYLLCFKVLVDENKHSVSVEKSNFSKDACSTPVTGIDKCSSRDYELHVMLCTLGKEIVEVKMTKDLVFLSCKLRIELPPMLQPMGLGLSANGMFIGILSHIATMYDPMKVKEPLQLIIHCLMDIEKACDFVLGEVRRDCQALTQLADCLDRIHLHMSNKGALPVALRTFLSECADNLASMSTRKLQLFRFLESIKVATTGSEESEKNVKKVSECILQRHIESLTARHTGRSLTDEQMQSAQRFADWIFHCTGKRADSIYKLMCGDLPKTEGAEGEVCVICGGEVQLKSMYYGECAKRHRFGRCMHSLLLCHETPYRKCPSCRTISHKRGIWEEDPLCIFCGSSLH